MIGRRMYRYGWRGDFDFYVVVGETKCGWYIAQEYLYMDVVNSEKKWISKTARRPFAFFTKEEALESYLFRGKAHLDILHEREATVRQSIIRAERALRKYKRKIRVSEKTWTPNKETGKINLEIMY